MLENLEKKFNALNKNQQKFLLGGGGTGSGTDEFPDDPPPAT